MLRFTVRRLLLLVPILIGLSLLVFVWIRALPGTPAEALLGERADEQSIAEIRDQLGLDDPFYVQYWRYVQTLAEGDLGTSIISRRPITEEIKERFPATIELALAAGFFALLFGVPLGFFAAKRYGGLFDNASLFLSLIGVSIPIFFLAIILKWVFAVRLGWLPSIGRQDVYIDAEHPTNFYVLDGIVTRNWDATWDAIKHLILPAIALGSIPLALISRITRASVLDVQNEDYVRTARAKGLPPHIVDGRHVFRNALLPVTTVIGLQIGLLLSGAILTETVFAFPGIGTWIQASIENRDYPVLQGGILFIAVIVVVVNLMVDISYGFLESTHSTVGPLMGVVEIEAQQIPLQTTPGGLWNEAFYRLVRNPGAIVGAVIVTAFVVVALFAPLLAPYSPTDVNLDLVADGCCPGPSWEHPMGVDDLGRDELSRVIYGARYSLLIGIVSVTVGLTAGLLLGSVAGYFGRLDNLIMRVVDIMLAIPGFLMAIGIAALMGPGLLSVMIAIGIVNIPIFTRLMRGSILGQKENDYVLAARAVGVPNRKVLANHILPNAISPVIVAGTLALATAIIDAAGLGFLGLGPQEPSTPEWGTMLTDAVRYLQTAPFLAFFPGLAIVIVVMGFNLIGDGLREALDPKLRGRA